MTELKLDVLLTLFVDFTSAESRMFLTSLRQKLIDLILELLRLLWFEDENYAAPITRLMTAPLWGIIRREQRTRLMTAPPWGFIRCQQRETFISIQIIITLIYRTWNDNTSPWGAWGYFGQLENNRHSACGTCMSRLYDGAYHHAMECLECTWPFMDMLLQIKCLCSSTHLR